MERMIAELQKALKAKEERRHRLARLPYHEKVKVLVKMQSIAYPLAAGRNPRACVGNLHGGAVQRPAGCQPSTAR